MSYRTECLISFFEDKLSLHCNLEKNAENRTMREYMYEGELIDDMRYCIGRMGIVIYGKGKAEL